MNSYVCSICGYVYDEAVGSPQSGIAPGTRWEDLPEDWICLLCGAAKSAFRPQAAAPAPPVPQAPVPPPAAPAVDHELSPMEMSILCSNLARGCEKQYLETESNQFRALADHFRTRAAAPADPSFPKLLDLVQQDLESAYPYANAAAGQEPDRGAMRALVWSEKVSRILDALLQRYAREGDGLFQNTGVYVCTICGFVWVGDAPPEICPVCKVPSWKFEQMERGA